MDGHRERASVEVKERGNVWMGEWKWEIVGVREEDG